MKLWEGSKANWILSLKLKIDFLSMIRVSIMVETIQEGTRENMQPRIFIIRDKIWPMHLKNCVKNRNKGLYQVRKINKSQKAKGKSS